MAALPFNQTLRPLLAVRTYARRAMAQKQGREPRLLQRRVTAARFGVNELPHTLRQSLDQDLG